MVLMKLWIVFFEDKSEKEEYFYTRFQLSRWMATIIVTCRNKEVREKDIERALIRDETPVIYLWPFTPQQTKTYVEKYAKYIEEYIKKLKKALEDAEKEIDQNLGITDPNSKEGRARAFYKAREKPRIAIPELWKVEQYEEAMGAIPGLDGMITEPFMLRLVLAALPGINKKYGKHNQVSRVQVYESFANQWFDFQIADIKKK